MRGSPQAPRLRRVMVFMGAIYLALMGRALFLHLAPPSEEALARIADRQYHQKVKLAPRRGAILDRKGTPLAISVRAPSLAINPRSFAPSRQQKKKLARLVGVSSSRLTQLSRRRGYFAWLARKVPAEVAMQVQALAIPGVVVMEEPARRYPGGKIAANLLGYVGIDNRGLLGIEQQFDSLLREESQETQYFRDARGRTILLEPSYARPARAGQDLTLTIDAVIQEIAESALRKWVRLAGARRGFVLVSDPHSGKILAAANEPTFDPNTRRLPGLAPTKNLAFTFSWEPGSTIKPFVVAAALEDGRLRRGEIHHCEKSGRLEVTPGRYIHDTRPSEFLTTSEVLSHSSNICLYRIAQRLGREGLYRYLKKFGFAPSEPLLPFPGGVSGRLSPAESWRPMRFANISFGQGMTATGPELLRAFQTLANGGRWVAPTIIEETEGASTPGDRVGTQVLSPETANTMKEFLAAVVSRGGGSAAATDAYHTAGKTGTSEKIDPEKKRYSQTLRVASFAGFAPVRDPHLVVLVVIDEPRVKPYYGGKWAAPAFAEIVAQALKYLNVAPDTYGSRS